MFNLLGSQQFEGGFFYVHPFSSTTVNLLKPTPPQRFSATPLLPLLYTVESKSLRPVPRQSPASSTEWPFVRESHEFTKYEMSEYERKAIPTIKTIGPKHSLDASKMMSFFIGNYLFIIRRSESA